MKLWHVAQWGNRDDGPNGWDTQCLVTAIDLESAVQKAEHHFSEYVDPTKPYRHGKADMIVLLGDDGRPDGESQLVTFIWVAVMANLCDYPSWHIHEGMWVDTKELFG